jgi:hypothetical protein
MFITDNKVLKLSFSRIRIILVIGSNRSAKRRIKMVGQELHIIWSQLSWQIHECHLSWCLGLYSTHPSLLPSPGANEIATIPVKVEANWDMACHSADSHKCPGVVLGNLLNNQSSTQFLSWESESPFPKQFHSSTALLWFLLLNAPKESL